MRPTSPRQSIAERAYDPRTLLPGTGFVLAATVSLLLWGVIAGVAALL